MLSILLKWFMIDLAIDQWSKQTIYVRYFNEFILGLLRNLPVIKADAMCYILYWVGLKFN